MIGKNGPARTVRAGPFFNPNHPCGRVRAAVAQQLSTSDVEGALWDANETHLLITFVSESIITTPLMERYGQVLLIAIPGFLGLILIEKLYASGGAKTERL